MTAIEAPSGAICIGYHRAYRRWDTIRIDGHTKSATYIYNYTTKQASSHTRIENWHRYKDLKVISTDLEKALYRV